MRSESVYAAVAPPLLSPGDGASAASAQLAQPFSCGLLRLERFRF